MPRVSIRHRTVYRYRNPVSFGEHRMMLRPLEGRDQKLVSSRLHIDPAPAMLRHVEDVFGNGLGIARFSGRAKALAFESLAVVDHTPTGGEEAADSRSGGLPGPGDPGEPPDLAGCVARAYADPHGEVDAWARRFVGRPGPAGAGLFSAITGAIHEDFRYGTRLEGHPQSPLETLRLGAGSCRDFAVLLMEAARSLGFAARFVSGYVYPAGGGAQGRAGGGHTHAWTRIHLPARGWVDFDPTAGLTGSGGLIRVAVTRDPRQALPLHGTWSGPASDCLGMEVEVDVRAEPEDFLQPLPPLRLASGG